jgi:hypothetical protein
LLEALGQLSFNLIVGRSIQPQHCVIGEGGQDSAGAFLVEAHWIEIASPAAHDTSKRIRAVTRLDIAG